MGWKRRNGETTRSRPDIRTKKTDGKVRGINLTEYSYINGESLVIR